MDISVSAILPHQLTCCSSQDPHQKRYFIVNKSLKIYIKI
jgi:hypothetical protein